MQSEASFSKAFVRAFRSAGYHVQKFEDRFSVGIPDVNVCRDGTEFWVELKVVKLPKQGDITVAIPLRDYQVAWNNARTKSGGRCMLVIGTADGVYVFLWRDLCVKDTRPFVSMSRHSCNVRAVLGPVPVSSVPSKLKWVRF